METTIFGGVFKHLPYEKCCVFFNKNFRIHHKNAAVLALKNPKDIYYSSLYYHTFISGRGGKSFIYFFKLIVD